VLEVGSPELSQNLPDLQIVRLVADERATHDVVDGEIEVSGSLGGQILVWEYATAVAGRILGINPFDQPDVESAKIATRGLLDAQPKPTKPAFTAGGIEVRLSGLKPEAESLQAAVAALIDAVPAEGYIAVQAYLDRVAHPEVAGLRDLLAARAKRPVTFGWGPRFLHSTGQFHKGGPAIGVFLQLVSAHDGGAGDEDLEIPDRPFTFGQLLQAQAAGDASVLAEHGRPVLTLTVKDVPSAVAELRAAIG
jgi:glucose-6-phosphate isomerase